MEKIKKALDLFFEDGDVFEVRMFDSKGYTEFGYYDNTTEAAQHAHNKERSQKYKGIYFVPNPVKQAALARSQNRLRPGTKGSNSTTDNDILSRRWLLVDVDPDRMSGIGATESEKIEAWTVVQDVLSTMTRMGFNDPIEADSGNGYHLMYKIDLPNDAASTELIQTTLKALAFLHSTPAAHVDTSVFNAARIWKLYGTTARKGDHTDDRPHRQAKVIRVPEQIKVNDKTLLERLAAMLPVEEPKATHKTTSKAPGFDLESFISQHGLSVHREKNKAAGIIYELSECPFDPAHKDGDAAIIELNSGALSFKCFHNSCQQYKWHDLREKFEPGYKDKQKTPTKAAKDIPVDGDPDVLSMLSTDNKGRPYASISNAEIILLHDPVIGGKIGHNEFLDDTVITDDLPWRKKAALDPDNTFKDSDYAHVNKHLEQYGISNRGRIEDALTIASMKKKFHPVRDYIQSVEWDGTHRAETLLIDYMGAEDTPINRVFSEKFLISAVARVFEPGCKCDEMLVLVGEQGVGKSTFCDKLGGQWFSDTLDNLGHKDSYGQIQGTWILEIGELTATKKSDKERMKAFLSSRRDKYRKSYGRREQVVPRQNIFVGSTNDFQFINDLTGGRRFWPVSVMVNKPPRDMWKELTPDEVSQVWAEAYVMYKAGEQWHLNKDEEKLARSVQADHMEEDPLEATILEYLDTPVPIDWDEWTPEERRRYKWDHIYPPARAYGVNHDTLKMITHVNADMIGNEALNKKPGSLSQWERKNINTAIRRACPGWSYKSQVRVEKYGKKSGFVRDEAIPVPKGFHLLPGGADVLELKKNKA